MEPKPVTTTTCRSTRSAVAYRSVIFAADIFAPSKREPSFLKPFELPPIGARGLSSLTSDAILINHPIAFAAAKRGASELV